jgi:EmrB/QacA subfamily drug resistance transporter
MVNSELVHRRRWKVLSVLCVALAITSIDTTILSVALPRVVEDINASGSQLQWILDSYTIVFACLLLAAGALGDRFGRRGTLAIGLGAFGIFSLVASASQTPGQLILARALMGGAGAFIFPTTLSLLTNVFTDPRERSRAIGIWSALSGVGVAIGPPVGGILVEHLGWHSVFWINAPICAVAVVLAVMIIPPIETEADRPLDPVGALISIVALVGLLYAIIELPNGWADAGVVLGFAVSIIGLFAFAWWESRVEHPMLDVRFFRDPRFSAASATIVLMTFAMYASTFLMTLYFQFTLGYSPVKAGLLLTPVAVGMMLSATHSSRMVERFGTKTVCIGGVTVLAVAMLCYASDTIMSSFALGLLVRFVYGIGLGYCGPPLTESIMGSLPRERAGVGSAVNDTTRQVGGALGVAVLGSVFAARYHHAMDRVTDIPDTVREQARESIGATVNVASRISDNELATRIREAGFDAFRSSMRVTYALSAAIMVGAVYIVWRYLPATAPDAHVSVVEISNDPPLAAAVDLDDHSA